jgi:putative transposase
VSAFIDQARARYGVEPICRTLGVSASAYYERASGERSARQVEDERLAGRIRTVHEQNFECYGYRRVWHQLRREGETAGRDQVARLMRQEGYPRREAAWEAVADDHPEPRGGQAP